MTYLIALIVAIGLGAVLAILSFINTGNSFHDQKSKGEAQDIIKQTNELTLSIIAYENIFQKEFEIEKDESDNFNFNTLVESGLLKSNINTDEWLFNEDTINSTVDLQVIVSNEKSCQYINHIKNGIDINAPVENCDTSIYSCCLN